MDRFADSQTLPPRQSERGVQVPVDVPVALTFFALWPEGFLIAIAGATAAGVRGMVGTAIALSFLRKEPTEVDKISD